jgi:GH25 family lysozyme M1 (1,4-beta-N-acetylmuramidase)
LEQEMSFFEGIIDVYDENELDLDEARRHGIGLILHQSSAGLYKRDAAYAERKQAALEQGLLWSAYHLLSAEDTEQQLDRFLSIEDGSDPRIGLAIDWEKSREGTMAYPELRRFVGLFNERMKPRYPDRYPILYSGKLFRETPGIVAGDALLAKCPLWYARYTSSTDLGIPKRTWETYTLWQFADEDRQFGGPPPNVLKGADFNRFQGSIDELQRAWPFAGPAHIAPPEDIHAPSETVSFADRAATIAGQEWRFFGKQTMNLAGNVIDIGHKEGDAGFFQRVGTYWLEGVNIQGIDGRNHRKAWSAAFVSYIMKKAGAGARFRYNAQHSQYISRAIRDFKQQNADAGYWCRRLGDAQPKVGDIVCWAREAGIDYDHQNDGDYAGHCDLIVAVRDGQVDVIGGNVSNSVTKRPLALDAAGFVKPTVQDEETLFAIMQNRIAGQAPGSPDV